MRRLKSNLKKILKRKKELENGKPETPMPLDEFVMYSMLSDRFGGYKDAKRRIERGLPVVPNSFQGSFLYPKKIDK